MYQLLWLTIIFLIVMIVGFKLLPKTRVFQHYYQGRAKHLVMVTYNSQRRIEWMIWSYKFWNDLAEPKGSITCVDIGSTDDTLKILDRLHHRCPQLHIVSLQSTDDDVFETWLSRQQLPKERLLVLDLRETENDTQINQELA